MSLRELMGDAGEFYPGSHERRQVNHVPDEVAEAPELGDGKILIVAGYEVEFFEIGALASALNRKTGTIRMWENERILPPSGWVKPGKDRDVRGRRRLWTRPQIEGVWRIAKDEGVLDPGPHVKVTSTQFTARVAALFEELRRKGVR